MSVLARTDWNFIYHLHGSVHFAMTGVPHDLHGITWTATPSKNGPVHAIVRNSQNSMEGTSYPMSPFVAGYGKTQQILRQPFRIYFDQVNRLVHEADSLLFLGYGFGDLHLNAAFSEVRNRHRPIVVVDWDRREARLACLPRGQLDLPPVRDLARKCARGTGIGSGPEGGE
jgi:hypothetical protein